MSVVVHRTAQFDGWLRRLKDANAVAGIVGRIRRLEGGNPGDVKSVGKGIMEMRIDYGPGYRVYYVHWGPVIVTLLCGGDKQTQARDVRRAMKLAEQL
jgi:putative addiction module killer protein